MDFVWIIKLSWLPISSCGSQHNVFYVIASNAGSNTHIITHSSFPEKCIQKKINILINVSIKYSEYHYNRSDL